MRTRKEKFEVFWKSASALLLITAIILLCLVKYRSDNEIETLNLEKQELNNKKAILEVDIDFLVEENRLQKAENDTLSWEVSFLEDMLNYSEKLRKANEKIRPFLTREEIIIDGKMFTRVGIIERNSDFYKGVTELLIPMENCQKYADSCFLAFLSEIECTTDSMKTNITIGPVDGEADTTYNDNFGFSRHFLSKIQMEMMVQQYGFSKVDYSKNVNCFNANVNPRDNQFAYNFRIVNVDEKLQKKSRVQNGFGKALRIIGMSGETFLWHSDKQFAITDDGIGPYEDGNRFKSSNVDDLQTGKIKAGVEVLSWLLYLGGEILDGFSDWNYRNSFKEQNMQILYEREYLPYIPANEYREYNK